MNLFQKRIDCYSNTKLISKQCYPVYKPSIKYKYDDAFQLRNNNYNTITRIVDNDTIDTAIMYIKDGYKPLVLNLADDCIPGGAVELGSGAQEESLFRRSNYCLSCNSDFYPLRADEAIYSPEIVVFKDTEANNWRLYENVVKMDFIACPGLKYPKTISNWLLPDDVETLKNKIRLIFQTGYNNGHDVLILGALGCGAWRSPPEHVAEICLEICKEYHGMFKYVVFAILGIGNTGINNYNVFMKTFSQK